MKAQNLYHENNKKMKLFAKANRNYRNEELKKFEKILSISEMMMTRGGGEDETGIIKK